MVKIDNESILGILVKQHGWEKCVEKHVVPIQLEYYRSSCGRFTLQVTDSSNIFDPETGNGWWLHIDNSDMQSIAGCDVEYIEQVLIITSLYQSY